MDNVGIARASRTASTPIITGQGWFVIHVPNLVQNGDCTSFARPRRNGSVSAETWVPSSPNRAGSRVSAPRMAKITAIADV